MDDTERAVEDAAKEGRKLTYDADGTTFLLSLNPHPEDARDEIARLRAALADAQAVGFAAGVEAAAKKADPDGWEPECCRDMRIAIAHHIRAIAGDTP